MEQKLRQDLKIGPNIRRLRLQSDLTQEQVTAKMQLMGINISRSIYSQIEGGTYNIRISELAAMKEIFNIGYESFFEGITLTPHDFRG
ncbi:MAG: helix-turn-helix domain-containing protein [Clostridium sp.]|nr:helix-turn-helix domain-containing protein [Clostridium sp.]